MCVGSAGGELAQEIARGDSDMVGAFKLALLAKDALKRVLGEELMRQMVDEDIPLALGVDPKDLN